MNLIKTNHVEEVNNYPYGFTLKTTLFDSIEFDKKKGYRHVTQTINPKNGALNKPKKSTYSALVVRYFDENNHIKTLHFCFDSCEDMNKIAEFVNTNFDLFSDKEIEYIYFNLLAYSKMSMKAKVIYKGAKFEDLKPFFDTFVNTCIQGLSNPINLFHLLKFDIQGIENTYQKEFNPFVTTEMVTL